MARQTILFKSRWLDKQLCLPVVGKVREERGCVFQLATDVRYCLVHPGGNTATLSHLYQFFSCCPCKLAFKNLIQNAKGMKLKSRDRYIHGKID